MNEKKQEKKQQNVSSKQWLQISPNIQQKEV